MATIKIQGELEIDPERGVIYFHSAETGTTALRISALPTPVPRPQPGKGLDIGLNTNTAPFAVTQIYGVHFNWKGDGR